MTLSELMKGIDGIRILGDVPFYPAHDSADVWSRPDLFQLDRKGKPIKVAGVPPDYFSEDGQLWGNLHNLHRSDMLNGDCDACHQASGRRSRRLRSGL